MTLAESTTAYKSHNGVPLQMCKAVNDPNLPKGSKYLCKPVEGPATHFLRTAGLIPLAFCDYVSRHTDNISRINRCHNIELLCRFNHRRL